MPKVTSEKKKGKTGRPKKFGRPTRAFYLVLPEDTVAKLRLLDSDIATAIVKFVEGTPLNTLPDGVEATALTPDKTLLWVGEVPTLKTWPGILLAPIEPGRNLLVLEPHYNLCTFELELLDTLADNTIQPEELPILSKLAGILRNLRRDGLTILNPCLPSLR
jgi:hypothetical protein